jgi:hypothetical protein
MAGGARLGMRTTPMLVVRVAAGQNLSLDVSPRRRGSGGWLAATDAVDLSLARQVHCSQEIRNQRKEIHEAV